MEEVNSAVAAEEARVLPDWIGGSGGGEKRKNGDDSEADSSKKARSEEEPVKVDPDSGEASTSQGKPTSSEDPEVKPEIKKETADSTSSPLRPSCEFGVRCYRRTLEHRTQFAHPNDSDYRRPTFPPAPSDAPHCPYGASCYRRNPQHFRDFQHPDSSEYRRGMWSMSCSHFTPVLKSFPGHLSSRSTRLELMLAFACLSLLIVALLVKLSRLQSSLLCDSSSVRGGHSKDSLGRF